MKFDLFYFQNTIVEQDDAILFNNENQITNMHGINRIEAFVNYKSDEELIEYYKTYELNENNFIFKIFFTTKPIKSIRKST